MPSRMTCVVVYGSMSLRERILSVRICMDLFDSFRVWGLFLWFNDVFIVLFRFERKWSAYFYRLAVRREEEREFCIWGLHGFAWRYYGSGLIFSVFMVMCVVVYCFYFA